MNDPVQRIHQFDGSMNYSPPVINDVAPWSAAEQVIDRLSQRGGYAVVYSDEVQQWSESIAAGTEMTVVTAVDDTPSLNRLRRRWYDSSRGH